MMMMIRERQSARRFVCSVKHWRELLAIGVVDAAVGALGLVIDGTSWLIEESFCLMKLF
jgi:hypothetical protein